MSRFTQKYTIIHLLKMLPDGYQYSMQNWPLHVTLADVFAISGEWNSLLNDLKLRMDQETAPSSQVIGEDLFREDKSIKVKLLEKTSELQRLHEIIVEVLEKHNVAFNSPQYTKIGFKPHSTEQKEGSLQLGDTIRFDSITLIDMFPDGDPYQRRVLGTIHFS